MRTVNLKQTMLLHLLKQFLVILNITITVFHLKHTSLVRP